MTSQAHHYERRDSFDVCRQCGMVRNRDAVGPRWCPGRLPAVAVRAPGEAMTPDPRTMCEARRLGAT
jgi:hypothetical protein